MAANHASAPLPLVECNDLLDVGREGVEFRGGHRVILGDVQDGLAQRGLAGADRADDRYHFPIVYVRVDVLNDRGVPGPGRRRPGFGLVGPMKTLIHVVTQRYSMPPRGEQGDVGTDADAIPLQVVLDVFEHRQDRARPVTATDVMDAIGCSRRTAHNKLNELVDRGFLKTRKVGSRSRVWWVPIEEEPGDGRALDPTTRQKIQDVDLPGTGKTLESRRDALRAAYEYLKNHPQARKSDFLQDVFPENQAEYETAEGWWNAIQPALAQLPGVDPPEERGHIWHFLGG